MTNLPATTLGATLALLAATLSSHSGVAAPLQVPIAGCVGAAVAGFVGDYPRNTTGDAAPGAMRQFLGIRYAKPPIGADRWQPPKPFCWKGVRPAKEFGHFCPQRGGGAFNGEEDCLTLNIYAPPTGNYSNLPVMVYFHSSSFISGKGSFWGQNPVDLVQQGVIVVTLNYRLGALGFLAHPELDNKATKNTGNYGFLDQQEALRWVKKNIAAFGGDRNNVTIFGSVAGGVSVMIHLVSPLSLGLFDKAIVQTGSLYQRPFPLLEAEQWGLKFGANVGCNTAACLRALSVNTIVRNQHVIERGDIENLRIDGVVLSDSLMNLLMAGKFHKVPIINGTNRDDSGNIHEDQVVGTGTPCGYVSNIVPNGKDTFPGAISYHDALIHLMGPTSNLRPLVEREYNAGSTGLSATLAYRDIKTDFRGACRALRVDDWIARAGGELFAYEFNDRNAPNFVTVPFKTHDGSHLPLGAFQGSETQYLFRMPPKVLCEQRYPGKSPAQKALAKAMVTYWTTFAKTGDPNPAGASAPPVWPRFTTAKRQLMSLDAPRPRVISAATFDGRHRCSSFWNEHLE